MESAKPSSGMSFATQLYNTASEKLPPPLVDFASSSGPFLAAIGVFALFVSLAAISSSSKKRRVREAPAIPERIPFVSNTYAYVKDLPSFCRNVGRYLASSGLPIATFRLFFQKVHIVKGAEATTPLFQQRTSGLSEHKFMLMFWKATTDLPPHDLKQWAIDTSGRNKMPLPGSEHLKGDQRIIVQWYGLMTNYLARPSMALELAEMYFERFLERLERVGANAATTTKGPGRGAGDGWERIEILDWMRQNITPAAATSLGGNLFLEMYPDYLDVMRKFELAVIPLTFGPPRWMNPAPYRLRDKWLAMNEKVIARALETAPEGWERDGGAHPNWIPELGHTVIRKLVHWLGHERRMSHRTVAGVYGALIMDQNGNTVPAAAWAVMHILTSPASASLVSRLRAEAAEARRETGDGGLAFDIAKLAGMPLHAAVFAETLRLHAHFNITRMATRDVTLGGYAVRRGHLVQAPTLIAHFDRAVWEEEEEDGHGRRWRRRYPVDEFWPDRMLRAVPGGDGEKGKDKKVEFDMSSKGRASYWFPFGGGQSICPGRVFAKQKVCLTLAVFFTVLEARVVGWEMLGPDGKSDGRKSDRSARDVEGFVTMLPDRELCVEVRRRSY